MTIKALAIPIRRDVIFESGGKTVHGFIEISAVVPDGNEIRCDLTAELGRQWKGSVFGVDLMQALSVAIRVLESHMEDVDARVE